ncbi:MAG: DUF4064 domain-containing protein [Dehalococcoidia bacterium]|nr:DUF4064 domain-containing protein [Dehalococcoidia bacterium]
MANSNSSTWMPTAGGVLNIVTGVLGIVGSLTLGILAIVFQSLQNNPDFYPDDPEVVPVLIAVFWVCCVFVLIPSIISIVGGVFAIQRKKWGWALAGSICAVLCSTITGVLALIFIIMGKKEFSKQINDA